MPAHRRGRVSHRRPHQRRLGSGTLRRHQGRQRSINTHRQAEKFPQPPHTHHFKRHGQDRPGLRGPRRHKVLRGQPVTISHLQHPQVVHRRADEGGDRPASPRADEAGVGPAPEQRGGSGQREPVPVGHRQQERWAFREDAEEAALPRLRQVPAQQ